MNKYIFKQSRSLLSFIKAKNVIAFLLFYFFVYGANSYNKHPVDEKLHSLRETIEALDITREKTSSELQKLLTMQNTSLKKEADEYSIFISYLTYQINTYCQDAYRQYGSSAINDLACERNALLSEDEISNYNTSSVRTSDEQIDMLDTELMDSLGEFDEMLLTENEKLAQITQREDSRTKSQNSNGDSNQNSSEANNGDQDGNEKNKNSEQKNSSEMEQKGSEADNNDNRYSQNKTGKIKGQEKSTGSIGSRERIKLDKIDDDIVARQLKEAAEKEIDPQLKQKLWNEYYRYKKNNL